FYFPYLWKYTNGYGGEVEYTYVSDGESHGVYERIGTSNYEMPTRGYSWYVVEHSANPGRGEIVKTQYSYDGRCYDQGWPGDCGSSTNGDSVGGIGGHEKVSVTTVDNTNTKIARTVTTYFDSGNLQGKADIVKTGYPNSGASFELNTNFPYHEMNYNYGNHAFGPTTFNFLEEEISQNKYPGGNWMTTKKKYAYEQSYQKHKNKVNDGQLGQLTHIEEYIGSNPNPFRVTRNWYMIDWATNNWVVKPQSSQVFTGTTSTNYGTLVSGVRYHYDANPSDPINTNRDWDNQHYRLSKGNLTRTEVIVPSTRTCGQLSPSINCNGVDVWYDTYNTVYTYDSNSGQMLTENVNPSIGYLASKTGSSQWNYATYWPTTNGQTTTITYDQDYELYPVEVDNALGDTTKFSVYGFSATTGGFSNQPLGFQQQRGLLRHVEDPNGLKTFYEYDPFGRLFQVYDPIAMSLQTTGFNNSSISDGNPLMRYHYFDNWWIGTPQLNPAGNSPFPIVTLTRPNQSTTHEFSRVVTYHDGFGRVLQTQQRNLDLNNNGTQDRLVTTQAYNALGQIKCQSLPYRIADVVGVGFDTSWCSSHPHTYTTYDYKWPGNVELLDPNGKVSKVFNDVLFSSHGVSFGEPMMVSSSVDGNDHARSTVTNRRGQMVKVLEFTGTDPYQLYAETQYEYDDLDNLIKVTDDVGNVTDIAYDALSRKASMDDPDMGFWEYGYDGLGNLKQQKDANGNRVCFWYDDLNRVTDKSEKTDGQPCPANPPALNGQGWLADYSYDWDAQMGHPTGIGKLAQIRFAPNGNLNFQTFTYDSFGRLKDSSTSIEDPNNPGSNIRKWMKYTQYDSIGRPTKIQFPDGTVQEITYDRMGANRFKFGGQNTNIIDVMTHTEQGQLEMIGRAGVANSVYSYNNGGQLIQLRHGLLMT
ncbi:MAG: hypothetical protein AAGD96_28120, partial [Chloroflexota bacterium]